ncbi:Astacin-like metalloendopeptidase [Strongyloides ratti]|uniref:Metalloendopeptidase n=1 Tax=Strongyloides ratti TaxID=34506 RepID=A0A090KZP6_STRRB|nr:Astacin-like metalloendopeptidase [Strongyloides ratti]CEF61332.2 Astacin-like metalloendopeptidase [Strongyloides ratti]
MTNLKAVFLYSTVCNLYILFSVINLTNCYTDEELEKVRYLKRSIMQINYTNYIIEEKDFITSIRKKRKVLMKQYKWVSPINYYVHYTINFRFVFSVVKMIEKETCIKFQRQKKIPPSSSGIRFIFSRKCSSFMGKQFEEGWQDVGIGHQCHNFGGILHETLHALGLINEQCRLDRKFYVTIFDKNINEECRNNFDKFSKQICYQFPYDYGSIMHDGMYAYSKNGMKTLIPNNRLYELTVGQREMCSFTDIKALNYHYCSKVCTKKIFCANYGYQNPKNCNKCKCVEGFGGVYCNSYSRNNRYCGNSIISVKKNVNFLKIHGKKNCFYHLNSKKQKKILIGILKINMEQSYSTTCNSNNAFEVKYMEDKSITGARFCHQKFARLIESKSSHVILYYRSSKHYNNVFIYFKEII